MIEPRGERPPAPFDRTAPPSGQLPVCESAADSLTLPPDHAAPPTIFFPVFLLVDPTAVTSSEVHVSVTRPPLCDVTRPSENE